MQAHVPGTVEPGGEPLLVGTLITIVLALYAAGLVRLWPHVRERGALAGRAAAFAAGCAALAVLLLGPLDSAAPRSFALHMVQHEGLMLIAAPLLVLGRGMPLFLWAMPHGLRLSLRAHIAIGSAAARLGRTDVAADRMAAARGGAVAVARAAAIQCGPAGSGTAPMAARDLPAQRAAVLACRAATRFAGAQGMALLYLFTTTIHTGVLGALLTFARRPLYASMEQGLAPWLGLMPLEDQQLGGLIMWVPGALVYVGMALWLMARWIGPERPGSLAR